MIISEIYFYTKSRLNKSSESSDIDIKLLVAACLGRSWSEVYTLPPTQSLTSAQLHKLDDLIAKKNRGIPTLLITKTTEFYGYHLRIFPHVLIPRPETEQLLSHLLQNISRFKPPVHIIEIGTGSGCLTVAICKELQKRHLDFKYLGFEIDSNAGKATMYNLSKHNLIDTDSAAQIILGAFDPQHIDNQVDIIIANPPYLTTTEYAKLAKSVKDFEPRIALDGGKDGLHIYRQIEKYVKTISPKPTLYLEIGPQIATSVKDLFSETYPNVRIAKDLFGLERFLFTE